MCVCTCFLFNASYILGCSGVGLTLNFNTTIMVNDTEYVTGIPTQCGDGYTIALCNDGTITQETSDTFCQSLGYNSMERSEGEGEGGRREGREGRRRGRLYIEELQAVVLLPLYFIEN